MSKIRDMLNGRTGIDALATDLLNGSHFLMDDIEWKLGTERGKKLGGGAYSYVLQESDVVATLWLMEKVWSQIRDLHERLAELRVYVDEHDEAIATALPMEGADV
jgi:hypothetical protein